MLLTAINLFANCSCSIPTNPHSIKGQTGIEFFWVTPPIPRLSSTKEKGILSKFNLIPIKELKLKIQTQTSLNSTYFRVLLFLIGMLLLANRHGSFRTYLGFILWEYISCLIEKAT